MRSFRLLVTLGLMISTLACGVKSDPLPPLERPRAKQTLDPAVRADDDGAETKKKKKSP